MAKASHLSKLKEGAEKWNKWRSSFFSIFVSPDLRKANFNGVHLDKINFKNSKLQDVNFQRAILKNANFQNANLTGANFQNANLTGANFQNANLSFVNFSMSTLDRANLRSCDLWKANFSKASLQKSNLKGTRLHKTNFNEANIKTIIIEKEKLEKITIPLINEVEKKIEAKQEFNLSKTDIKSLNERLFDAAKEGNIKDIKKLIKQGADVNYEYIKEYNIDFLPQTKFYYTPLTIAVKERHIETVQLLIEHGADLNYIDPLDKFSPLLLSMYHSENEPNPEIAKLLISNNANPNHESRGGANMINLTTKYPEIRKLIEDSKKNYTGAEKNIKKKEDNYERIKYDLQNSQGGLDVCKIFQKYKPTEIEFFCKNYPIKNIDIGMDASLTSSVKRFEEILIFAKILVQYNYQRENDPNINLPKEFPSEKMANIFLARLIPFVKTYENKEVAIILRDKIYQFAMDLMNEKKYQQATEFLKTSRPSLNGDDDYWIAACFFNIAQRSKKRNDINIAMMHIDDILKGRNKVPEKVMDTVQRMHQILMTL